MTVLQRADECICGNLRFRHLAWSQAPLFPWSTGAIPNSIRCMGVGTPTTTTTTTTTLLPFTIKINIHEWYGYGTSREYSCLRHLF